MYIRGKVPTYIDYTRIREWLVKKDISYPQAIYYYELLAKNKKIRWDWCFFLSLVMTGNFRNLKSKDFGCLGRSFLSIHDGVEAHLEAMERAEKHMKTFEAWCVEMKVDFTALQAVAEDFRIYASLPLDPDEPYEADLPPPPPVEVKPLPPVKPPETTLPPPSVPPVEQPKSKFSWFKLIFFVAIPTVLYTMCGR